MCSEFTLESPFTSVIHPSAEDSSTIPEFILKRVGEFVKNGLGEKFWMIGSDTDTCYKYEDFEQQTRKIASFLSKKGLCKGQAVVYSTSDFANLHLFFMGVWRANGHLLVSIPQDTKETFLERVIEVQSKFILCDSENLADCIWIKNNVNWEIEIILIEKNIKESLGSYTNFQTLLQDDGNYCPNLEIESEDPAFIFCTSGTTGKAKGAVMSHRSMLHLIRDVYCNFPYQEMNLFTMKAFHVSGSTYPLGVISTGQTCLCVADNSNENIFHAINKYQPQTMIGLPTILLNVINSNNQNGNNFNCLRIFLSGGSPITPATLKNILDFPSAESFITIYGLTENTIMATTANFSEGGRMIEDVPDFSVGQLVPRTQVQIRDPESGKCLKFGEKGEICTKSPSLFSGYLNLPEATSSAYIDGWLKTGDIGYIENGFLYVVDRIKEIFKCKGSHVSPTEMESIIGSHGKVKQVCVIPIEMENFGHVPRAFVVLKTEFSQINPSEIAQEIIDFTNNQVSDYKKLRGGVKIVTELPLGKTGKVTRDLVRRLDEDHRVNSL